MANISPALKALSDIALGDFVLSDEVFEFIRKHFTPVWADEFMTMYMIDGCMYIDRPHEDERNEEVEKPDPLAMYPEQREQEAAHSHIDYDPAVVLHLMHELAWSLREVHELYKSELLGRNRQFTEKEYRALEEARDLLVRYRDEYNGGSWE